jgi:threonine synthase
MGLAIWLDVVQIDRSRPLAIASCGNAALAAAVIAKAAARPLTVHVPTWADAAVIDRLRELGAAIQVCPRHDGDPPGDPCVHRFREAVASGAVPFSCQGPDNGLTIDGGRTLGYEIADAGVAIDDVIVQVGGGALASSVAQGLGEAGSLGALDTVPTIHVVQAAVHSPLVRAWERRRPDARRHRRELMWPWEPPGHSIATGILDDETYDWAAVLEGMVRTGGVPLVVDEATIAEANERARATTGIDVDHTGSAGLAGLIALRRAGDADPGERVALLFTGVRRAASVTERGGE